MGILVEDNERSKLQDRIAADLRERAARTAEVEERDVDLAEDSRHVEGLHKTKRFSWFWFVLIFLAILSLVVIFVLK
ncbi:hypothetical protein IJ102_01030 [Candidatus Saccharibacteria bacterium]|nr:hypothetical protein [Candidatus Saccharibacteria bacterium]